MDELIDPTLVRLWIKPNEHPARDERGAPQNLVGPNVI